MCSKIKIFERFMYHKNGIRKKSFFLLEFSFLLDLPLASSEVHHQEKKKKKKKKQQQQMDRADLNGLGVQPEPTTLLPSWLQSLAAWLGEPSYCLPGAVFDDVRPSPLTQS
jgi:hypothetical protein